MNENAIIIGAALVLVAAIVAFAYLQARPQRTIIDQLGGLGGIVGLL